MDDKQKLFIIMKAIEGNEDAPNVPYTLRYWAKSLRDNQKYESALTAWLGSVADALQTIKE